MGNTKSTRRSYPREFKTTKVVLHFGSIIKCILGFKHIFSCSFGNKHMRVYKVACHSTTSCVSTYVAALSV